MTSTRTSRLRRIAAVTTAACAVLGAAATHASAAYDPTDPAQLAQYQHALDLGKKAYEFGVPLVDMDRAYRTGTSTDICDHHAHGPVNQFCPFRELATVNDRDVVAPNQDTLYDNAWLDVSKQPVVITVPKASRFNVVPFLTPWQENFANVGEGAPGVLAPGDYVVTGPKFKGKLPAGLTQIKSPHTRAWVIARTYVNSADAADLARVHAIHDAMHIVPLNKWRGHGSDWTPPVPHHPDTTVDTATIPGTTAGDDPLHFFDALNTQMGEFPPTAADAPILTQLSELGITPGGRPVSRNRKLTDAQRQGLRDSVAAGTAQVAASVVQRYQQGFAQKNGWLVEGAGNYGTDYAFRSIIDLKGLGALPRNVALYPFTSTDRTGAPLNGSQRYVVHFNAPGNAVRQLPMPADAFWSLTLYDAKTLFVDNPINRYLLNDRSDLHYNADGSLDLYVQPNQPSDPAQAKNWLPSPAGAPFQLMMRLYGPPADRVAGIIDGSGWKAGTVLPCAGASTPAFPPSGITAPIACAS